MLLNTLIFVAFTLLYVRFYYNVLNKCFKIIFKTPKHFTEELFLKIVLLIFFFYFFSRYAQKMKLVNTFKPINQVDKVSVFFLGTENFKR